MGGDFLNKGGIVASNNKAFIGLNSVTELAKISDIPSIPDIPSVINSLTSSSTTDALSANQGQALKTLIDSVGSGLQVVFNDSASDYNSHSYEPDSSDLIVISYSSGSVKIYTSSFLCYYQYVSATSSWDNRIISNGGYVNISHYSYCAAMLLNCGNFYLGAVVSGGDCTMLVARDITYITVERPTALSITGYSFT